MTSNFAELDNDWEIRIWICNTELLEFNTPVKLELAKRKLACIGDNRYSSTNWNLSASPRKCNQFIDWFWRFNKNEPGMCLTWINFNSFKGPNRNIFQKLTVRHKTFFLVIVLCKSFINNAKKIIFCCRNYHVFG